MRTWVIPIRTAQGKLLGYQRKRGKYVENVPEDMRKSRTLFGIDVFDGGTAILVESPLDVVRLTSAGVDGGVAAFGAGVSKYQMNLLLEEADEIVLALDNDEAGILSTQKLKATYGRRIPLLTLCYDYTPDAKDVGEMEKDSQIRRAVDEAREFRPSRRKMDKLVV
jgi:DNA primase